MSEIEPDFLIYEIPKQEIQMFETGPTLQFLKGLLTPENCARYRNNLMVTVGGYDDDPRELFEIDEVRIFMIKIDNEWPYWLYFLSTDIPASISWIFMALSSGTSVPGGFAPGPNIGGIIAYRMQAMFALDDQTGVSEAEEAARIEVLQSLFDRGFRE